MTQPEIGRRRLLATVGAAAVPAVAGCSGSSVDEDDFTKVGEIVDYSSASRCAEMRMELEYTGDGDIAEVEFDTRLLDDNGDPVSDWQRSPADFSEFAPADRADVGGVWCSDREGTSTDIKRAAGADWRIRE